MVNILTKTEIDSGELNGWLDPQLQQENAIIHPVETDFSRGGKASIAFSAHCAAADEKPSVVYK